MDPYVRIFDTTLRDGEQSPGASMTKSEKLTVAQGLRRLGVDIIEAGFPAASPDDFAAVAAVATEIGTGPDAPTICGLARAATGDIDRALSALSKASKPRVHTFLATSPIHRTAKLRMSKEEVLARIHEMVTYVSARCDDVEFSPEDAGRTEPEFLHQAVRTAIQAGAKTINIPDTVGYTQPAEFGEVIAGILREVPEATGVVISVHCHNDLGLAVANTLAGLRAGARQAEVTINGIGERAGNTALEEVIMALETRRDIFGLTHGIHTEHLYPTSRLVSSTTGMEVQPNKAIVGRNAFAHEAGIHQDGMLKNQETYEIMRPESVGAPKTQLVMGKHSGRRALQSRLQELGIALEGELLDHAFVRFKALADRRKQVTDADLLALVRDEVEQDAEIFKLTRLVVTSRTDDLCTASITLDGPTQQYEKVAEGTGSVDAVFNAIDGILHSGAKLSQYQIRATNEGNDALGEALVHIRNEDGRSFRGFGSDQDVTVASARAYLAAQNKALAANKNAEIAKERVAS